jgi:hypothetical protein
VNDESSSPPSDGNGETPHYAAQDARGGDIVLRRRWQRWVFMAGLAGFVLLAILLRFALGY